MRTCTFCLATNPDDAPYCATCGRSGPSFPSAAPTPPSDAFGPVGEPPLGWSPRPGELPAAPTPPTPGFPPAPPAGAPFDPSVGPAGLWYGAPTPGLPPPEEPSSRRGPLVLVLGAAGAALLLLLAAYLGSIAPPAPASGLKHGRAAAPPLVVDGARGR